MTTREPPEAREDWLCWPVSKTQAWIQAASYEAVKDAETAYVTATTALIRVFVRGDSPAITHETLCAMLVDEAFQYEAVKHAWIAKNDADRLKANAERDARRAEREWKRT